MAAECLNCRAQPAQALSPWLQRPRSAAHPAGLKYALPLLLVAVAVAAAAAAALNIIPTKETIMSRTIKFAKAGGPEVLESSRVLITWRREQNRK